MKKIFSQVEYISMVVIIILSFFPWIGLLNNTAVDITVSVVKNIGSSTSVDQYAIAATVLLAVFAVIMALIGKANRLHVVLAFAAPIVGFVYGMITTSGDYFSSMDLAYIIVVVLSAVMLLQQFGIIKLKFLS